MTRPTILVTGATGKTGGAVAELLLRRGWPVRALVRRRDARSERLERLGAEAVVADLFDAEALADALRSTARAYFVPPMHPHMIHAAVAFADAARTAGLEQVVLMSQWTSSPSHPAPLTRHTWLADRLFASLPGVACTIVNPGMFADNFLRLSDMAAQLGVFPNLMGEGRSAPVANEDIARVVVAALGDPARHDGRRYRPTGPRLLSGRDIATILGEVLGRKVRAMPTPVWILAKVARIQGVDPYSVALLRWYVQDQKRGAFELDGGVTDVVRELTGAPAEDFATTARRYAALPFARPTLTNRLKALAQFAATPFVPGYDLDRLERVHGFPSPADPRLTMDSPTWLREHRTPNAPEVAPC